MRFRVTRYATCPCSGMVLLSILLIVTAAHSQTERTPFAPVPANQRASLKKRLNAYTEAFRKKDWAVLYGLVSDTNKVSVQDPKVRVDKDTFVRDMQDTADWQRLLKFTPVRTEIPDWLNLIQLRTETPDQVKSTPVREEIPDWLFDIYGCVEIPDGNQTLKRIGAVRAVWEHDNWYFTNWESAGPFEPCSHLSNPAWKPQLPLRLDNPMSQLTCDLYTCEL
jgi:hypothetical protein